MWMLVLVTVLSYTEEPIASRIGVYQTMDECLNSQILYDREFVADNQQVACVWFPSEFKPSPFWQGIY